MPIDALLPGLSAAIVVAVLIAVSGGVSLARRPRTRRPRDMGAVTSWTDDELGSLRRRRELAVDFSSSADGRTSQALRLPMVIVDGAVFIRDPAGSEAPAFQIALDHPRGSIDAPEWSRTVALAVADWSISDDIDAAFAETHPQRPELVNRSARSSTLRVDPISMSGSARYAMAA